MKKPKTRRCAACGKKINEGERIFKVIDCDPARKTGKTWGHFHDECFRVSFQTTDNALLLLRREAERVLNKRTT